VRDSLLQAKDNIYVGTAQITHKETAQTRRSGWSFDNRQSMPLGVHKDKQQGEGGLQTA